MWFRTFVFVAPYLGRRSNLTSIFFNWGSFNHQLETALGPRLTIEKWRLRNPYEIWVKYQVVRLKMRVSRGVPMEMGPTQPSARPSDLQAAMKEAIKLAGPGKPYDMKVPRMSFPPKKKGTCWTCLGYICQGWTTTQLYRDFSLTMT